MDRIRASNAVIMAALESVTPTDWLSAENYSDCATAVVMDGFLKKFEEPSRAGAEVRKNQALEGFLNRNRNTWTVKRPLVHQIPRLSVRDFCIFTDIVRSTMSGWFHGATFRLDDVGVGPGEGFTPAFGRTSALDKLSGVIDVTPDAESLLRKLIRRSYRLQKAYDHGEIAIRLVPGSRLGTVPKNNQKDRVICMEPDGNMMLQKALGQMFRRVYRKVTGRDLNNVQDFHRAIVNDGIVQVNGQLQMVSTIDLSAASDSISMLLVKRLLPPWIYELICTTRCDRTATVEDGRYDWHPLSVTSTMGNGFTFELLTLICLAVCKALECTFASAYGDDIIVDASSASQVMGALELLGFSVNRDKTCVNVPQLESCGAYSYDGIPIERYDFHWMQNDADVITLLNKLQRLAAFYEKSVPSLAQFTLGLWNKLYEINKDVLPLGPTTDCEVESRWVYVPPSLVPYTRSPLPSWAKYAVEAYQLDASECWVVKALHFDSDRTFMDYVEWFPNSYMFCQQLLNATPSLGIRGKGKWVEKITLCSSSGFVMTRSQWNSLSA